MQILLIIPFIFSMNIIGSSYRPTGCTLPATIYGPAYIQAHNAELQKWRQSLSECSLNEEHISFLRTSKNVIYVESMPLDLSNHRRCFQYAIETITGFNGYIGLPLDDEPVTINLAKYFQQTPYPQKNDLIIYTTDEKSRDIHHFAVALNKIWFQSKSGSYNEISKHLPFEALVEYYGKAVWSFGLRKKYHGNEGRKRLIYDIQLDLHQGMAMVAKSMKLQNKNIAEHNETIEDLRKQNNITKKKFFVLGFAASAAYIIILELVAQSYFSYTPPFF